MILRIFVFGIASVLSCLFANADVPIQTTPCELQANPLTFDEKLVTVRSAVTIGFEESTFDETCPGEDLESVWVTFAGECGNANRLLLWRS